MIIPNRFLFALLIVICTRFKVSFVVCLLDFSVIWNSIKSAISIYEVLLSVKTKLLSAMDSLFFLHGKLRNVFERIIPTVYNFYFFKNQITNFTYLMFSFAPYLAWKTASLNLLTPSIFYFGDFYLLKHIVMRYVAVAIWFSIFFYILSFTISFLPNKMWICILWC